MLQLLRQLLRIGLCWNSAGVAAHQQRHLSSFEPVELGPLPGDGLAALAALAAAPPADAAQLCARAGALYAEVKANPLPNPNPNLNPN